MPDLVHQTEGPGQTEALAAELTDRLRPGDVVLLFGEVGSGKTTFVRGACRALGIAGPVTSPTFTIGQRYDNASVSVSHLDLYRLGAGGEEDPSLLADYLTSDAIAFVEWPTAVGTQMELENVVMRLEFEHLGGDRRRITVL